MAHIKLKGLLNEAEDFQARSKQTGKLVHFKSKDAFQSALKAGTHEDPKAKKGGEPKADANPNDMFGADYAKDRGGDASSNRKWVNYDKDHSIDTNSGMIVPKGKESNNPNPKDIKGIDSIGAPAKTSSARKWINYDKDHSIDTNSGMIVPKGKESDTPNPKDIKGIDSIDTPKADGMATVNSIAAKTGMRAQAVAGWADENGVNLSKVSADIDSKKLNPKDLMTAVVGKPGNKYAKDIIAKYSQSSSPKSNMGVDSVVYNKKTNTVGIVRIADERGETKTDADGNVNTSDLEPYNPMKYPHQKDAKAAPSTKKEVDSRGLWNPFSQSDSTPATSKYDDAEYWKDAEKSDSLGGYYDSDDEDEDDDDYYDYDDEDGGGVELTSDRLDKVERALEDELKLNSNGFETTRESSGGMGGWEGPMTIVSNDADQDSGNYISLSVGSPENDGKFSIVFANDEGTPYFEPNYDALTGDTTLEPQQAFKITKALMKMPEVQKVLKGEMDIKQFEPIYNKLKSKFSKGKMESTKLTSMLKK